MFYTSVYSKYIFKLQDAPSKNLAFGFCRPKVFQTHNIEPYPIIFAGLRSLASSIFNINILDFQTTTFNILNPFLCLKVLLQKDLDVSSGRFLYSYYFQRQMSEQNNIYRAALVLLVPFILHISLNSSFKSLLIINFILNINT